MAAYVERSVTVVLPPEAPGAWCLVSVSAQGGAWWAQLCMSDRPDGQVLRQVFLGPCRRGIRKTLLPLPAETGALALHFIGSESAVPGPVEIKVLSRASAAWHLLVGGGRRLAIAMSGDRLGRLGRIRTELGQAPARKGEAPPYDVWLDLYEQPAAGSSPVALQGAVVGGTTASPGFLMVREPADWALLDGDYVLLLGPGERLAPHALARFGAAIAGAPWAKFLCADTDEMDAAGGRKNPLFKPKPGPVFLQSGLATAGACVFRREGDWSSVPVDADAARLLLAQRCVPETMLRIPAILTHLSVAPVAQAHVAQHSGRLGLPSVILIVASSCRSPHVLRCLRGILAATDYPCFDILLAVSRVDPGDRRQSACLAQAAALPHVRVLDLGLPEFNYAQVNNLAARQARGEFYLFMNDDVVPRDGGWLEVMVAHACASGVGAVGARLLYGNGTVQHAGVIMGLAGLCEHADRLMDSADAGDHGRALVDREVSAVTAACLLLRASLFEELGGFEEGFAVALNDVDLCLRIRQTGARIVYAAGAVLYHFESLSLGRHYQGARAAQEAIEVRRLRARWAEAISDDPFYNPQASLEPGREWQPGFPPRLVASCNSNFAKHTIEP